MLFKPLPLAGAFLIDLERREDDRGFFARFYCENEFAAHGLETRWVQMNTSLSRQTGTIRGLHLQKPPKAEAKVVRCLRGAIWDVIVDLREGSPTFAKWYATELNEDNRSMLYIPKGCAHGFQTLQQNSELLYLHSEFYSPEYEGGLKFDDPDIAISWPLHVTELSARDQNLPLLKEWIAPI